MEALPMAVDVTDEDAVASGHRPREQHFGQLDVLFNNAGIGSRDLSVARHAGG